jgi:thiamine biosynthesis protein ThiS
MKPDPITIVANGKQERLDSSCSVGDFLATHGWRPKQVVVERNGSVLTRDQVHTVILVNGDRLEVILPVAGG